MSKNTKEPFSVDEPSGVDRSSSLDEPSSIDVGVLFLANFVHQVVNPLNGVIGTLDNIHDGTYSGDIVDQKINASRAQLEQCVTLLRNLAYLSDYFFEESDRTHLRKPRELVWSPLQQTIIEAIQFFQILAGQKKIGMELIDSRRQQHRILIRPELLRQIFINFFDNWLKYGLKNQVVKVHVSTNSADDLVVEVEGKSIPFDNSKADSLFDFGVRDRHAIDKVAQGSGIGLYICKQIVVKSLKGNISAVHQGASAVSIFRVAIPKEKWKND
ncbi:HAMP domain-containing sensor histidine kinase [Pseudomonas guariconensis]|uniref:sensor histidine kinase n=1 Tax=Pseudomonas guariconensis TaxID=1288410 RepID=UPI00300C3F52